MKRSLLALSVVAIVAGILPSVALAEILEVGRTSTPLVAPTCPAGVAPINCTIVLTRVTALETLSDGVKNPTTVRRAGEIVAFTLGISSLSSNKKTAKQDVAFLDKTYGGNPQAEITVLRPFGKASGFGWTVAATSAPVQLQHYLGQVAQFPLSTPLPVVRGERLALTVPTWAPVLSFNLTPTKFAYRQSRKTNCKHTPGIVQAQTRVGQRAHYRCNYAGTRVEYTATEITSPSSSS